VLDVESLREAAAAVLPPEAVEYYNHGGFDELTLADNEEAWKRWAIIPRMLAGVAHRDLATTVLGRAWPHPVFISPTARHGLADPDGEIATAKAAAATDTVFCVSVGASKEPAEIAAAVPGVPRWLQICLFADRSASAELADLAEACGYEALVITVDNPIVGVRRHASVGIAASFASASPPLPGLPRRPDHERLQLDPAATWDDLEKFIGASSLPVLVKGLMSPDDARIAGQCGAAGVVVSNHGGRQLDRAPASADALPAMVDAVGNSIEVLVDGGIRSALDVFTALALGARAVGLGRPALWALAAGGAGGVEDLLRTMVSELDTILALSGAGRVARIDRSFVRPRTSGEQ
jgi:4-hydroxymandelate oxidase